MGSEKSAENGTADDQSRSTQVCDSASPRAAFDVSSVDEVMTAMYTDATLKHEP